MKFCKVGDLWHPKLFWYSISIEIKFNILINRDILLNLQENELDPSGVYTGDESSEMAWELTQNHIWWWISLEWIYITYAHGPKKRIL